MVDQAFKSVDPKGKEDGVSFDHAGQRVKLVEAWDDGDYSTGAADRDRTTEWAYTADGQVAIMTEPEYGQPGDQIRVRHDHDGIRRGA